MHFQLAYTTVLPLRLQGYLLLGFISLFRLPPHSDVGECGFVWKIQFSGGVGEGTIGKLFVLRSAISPERKRQKSIFLAKNPPRAKLEEEI